MPEILSVGKHMQARQLDQSKGRQVWEITDKKGVGLGKVEWYEPWRKYVFHPYVCTLFDESCLQAVAAFLRTLR